MKKITLLSVFLFLTGTLFSQLCSPTFSGGCFSWNTKSITLGSIDWEFDDIDCSVSNYTATSTSITAGTATPMTINSGTWCGVSVWIDINKDNLLTDNENFYHEGNGSTEMHDFSSDGFTPGANGSGGCGAYQYGNYQDFTITVVGGQAGVGLDELLNSTLILSPNPATDKLTLNTKAGFKEDFYIIISADGTLVSKGKIENSEQEISITDFNPGVYFLQLKNSFEVKMFIKQ